MAIQRRTYQEPDRPHVSPALLGLFRHRFRAMETKKVADTARYVEAENHGTRKSWPGVTEQI